MAGHRRTRGASLLLAAGCVLVWFGAVTDACQGRSDDSALTVLTWPRRLPRLLRPSAPPVDLDTGQPIRYRLRAFGRDLTLVLRLDTGFTAPRLHVENVHRNFSEVHELGRATARCFYRGSVERDRLSTVAVSLCKGMTGNIRTSDGNYLIWPSENRRLATAGAHVIQRYPATSRRPEESKWPRRERRSISEPHFIEVMVATDSKMAEYHGDQLQQYVLTLMSIVALIYKDPSIGNSMTISVVRIVVMDNDVLDSDKQNTWKNGKSASAMLHRFCRWQQRLNDDDASSGEHFDTAVLLTRENICRNPGLSRCDTLGLAELGTMCDPRASCSIIQDNGLSAAFTVAHELGHVLNIPHDDDFKCKEFMGKDKIEYAMSRMLNHNTNPWSWSKCSRHFLTDYLQGDYGRCLKNRPPVASALRRVDDTEPVKDQPRHPGQTYNATSQCRFLFGKEFKVCSYMPVCKRLWCSSGSEEAGCRTQHMPWADGTSCGRGRWCLKGACVIRRRRPVRVDGGWAGWGQWGGCSRTCGGGVRRSERQCDSPTPSGGGDYCLGQRVRYESCSRQQCPADSTEFREAQCATFDGNNFNIKGLPPTVRWVPKYTGIKPEDRCKLFCRVADSSAYYLLKGKVLDGTKCTPDTDDMCVSGACRPAGCDHVLGSSIRSDLCGVCGGDNSTCQVIRSRFDSATHRVRYGYNKVVRIPAGATRLDVRQTSHDDTSRDDNYLALMSPASGTYILNGNFEVSMFRKVLQFGGVLIEYTGSDSVVERINCSKPLEEDLELYVLSVRNLRPPDVVYEYVVSLADVESYRWQLADIWTDCDRVCNGVQYRLAECVRSSDLVRVADSHCPPAARPARLQMQCNTHCELKWEVTHRSQCSARCGPGRRQNVVRCFQKFPMYEMSPIGDQFCRQVADRPADWEPCEGECADASWRFGDWSQCSRSCGGGSQLRTATCVGPDDQPLADTSCRSAERHVERDCASTPCPTWHAGNWTECSATCGSGVSVRSLGCLSADGTPAEDQLCSESRPTVSRKCGRPPCPTEPTVAPARPDLAANLIDFHRSNVWRWGRWSKCSRRCGDGKRSRSVVCYNVHTSQPLSDYACRHVERPVPTERCRMRYCGRWTATEWSNCSASCGQGLEQRGVQCVSVEKADSLEDDQCDSLTVPVVERVCRSHLACSVGEQPAGNWITGAWGACSQSCGGGLRQRLVLCRGEEQSPGCAPSDKPNRTQPCGTEPCPAWRTGEWGQCSVSCGPGTRLRRVRCRRPRGAAEPDHLCPAAGRPDEVLPCRRPDCPAVTPSVGQPFSWRVSPWSKCSRSCGSGVQYRQVTCHRTNVLGWTEPQPAAGGCGRADRPAAARRCERSCTDQPRWKLGPWSKCSKPCGRSGFKYRKARCYSGAGRRVPRRRCPRTRRPRRRRRCNRRPCGPTSCLQARERAASGAADGQYRLVVGGRSVSIYCHGMNTSAPAEYLTLPRRRRNRSANFAEIDPKRLVQSSVCPYNGSRVHPARCDVCLSTRSPHSGLTVFKRVRLNVTSLTIMPRYFTFTRQVHGRPVSFGEAGDCYSSAACPQARFGISLAGTGLRVAAGVKWVGVGNQPTVRVARNKAGTTVRGLCGGFCGTCRANSPGGIQLEPVPP